MLDILTHFLAQDIYGITRLVCRKWYKMIRTHSFVHAHLQRSAHGILIQNLASIKTQMSFMSIRQGRIEITRLSYEPGYEIWCSCNVLTVGVDSSWRHVNTQHLSLEANKCLISCPLSTVGFVHWTRRGIYVLTLNIETEIITQYRVPTCCGEGFEYYYFSAVRYLSLLIKRGGFSWEVWEMKPESGEWTKVTSIDLEAQKCTIEHLICERDASFKLIGFACCRLEPVGWLKYRQVLVFYVRKPRLCIAYNVHSKEIELIELDSKSNAFLAHRNGLVWLDGC
ncbi:hypothetical protein PHJA_001874700 [Phtheirospermum japonicum]|uniref:F-box protein n=1 Tax=Phtheirospermum japonicum TaxID=374723 RepID=A0A830CDN6_9LAMI|nr:hypothetical protein PHJA_001874700 [Phtheirospermum japonicum]